MKYRMIEVDKNICKCNNVCILIHFVILYEKMEVFLNVIGNWEKIKKIMFLRENKKRAYALFLLNF